MWNQNVVIENKPGGAYAIAAAAAAMAAPDGHTLLATENGMFTTQPNLTPHRAYKTAPTLSRLRTSRAFPWRCSRIRRYR